MPLIFSKDIYPFSDCAAVGDEEKRYGEFRPLAVRKSGDNRFEIRVPTAGAFEWDPGTVYRLYRDILEEAARNRAESVSVPVFCDTSDPSAVKNALSIAETAVKEFLFENELIIYLCIPESSGRGKTEEKPFLFDEYIDQANYRDSLSMTQDELLRFRKKLLRELEKHPVGPNRSEKNAVFESNPVCYGKTQAYKPELACPLRETISTEYRKLSVKNGMKTRDSGKSCSNTVTRAG